MADVLTPAQRKLNMSRIRARDTKPEKMVRKMLHARGLRYRLHVRTLPGCPDLVFPKYHAVIQVHGCFWHGHDCPMFKIPATRRDFWVRKISGNCTRDRRNLEKLKQDGWRVMTVWECSLRGTARRPPEEIARLCYSFLLGSRRKQEIRGLWSSV